MIDSKIAAKQIERFSGLEFYPKEPAGLRELRGAMETAASEAVALRVASEWLDSNTRAPKPVELKERLYRANADHRQAKRCGACDGTGYITHYRLVTYANSGGFKIRKSADVQFPELDPRDIATEPGRVIRDLRAMCGPNQEVLSGVRPCVCLPANHLYFTGERE